MTRSVGKSPSPIASSVSSRVSGIGPGRASRMCQRRLGFAEITRKPREPLSAVGLVQTSTSGYPSSWAAARNSSGEVAVIERGIGTPSRPHSSIVLALSLQAVIASGDATSTGTSNWSTALDTAATSKDESGKTTSTPSRRASSARWPGNSSDEPGGTTWKASQIDRPPRRALMSVPTTASSRWPFCWRDFTSRPPPGEPAAVTSTRSGRSRSWLSLVASPSRADPCGMVWNRLKIGSPSGLPADGRDASGDSELILSPGAGSQASAAARLVAPSTFGPQQIANIDDSPVVLERLERVGATPGFHIDRMAVLARQLGGGAPPGEAEDPA